LFTLSGIEKGIAHDFSAGICIAPGTITGSFGGVLRDVLLNNVPLILQKESYASACIIGGIVYFVLLRFAGGPLQLVASKRLSQLKSPARPIMPAL
jgi:uncharacterized membrane protein YeiH